MAMELIASEDFKLTPAIKDAVHEKMEQVNKFLKKDESIIVNLAKESGDVFSVILQVHVYGHDFVGSSQDLDFYKALNQAKNHLVRQLADHKDKYVTSRHS